MTIPEAYRKLRGALPVDRVSIGYSSIELVRPNDLPSAQQGYAGGSGDWRAEWLVIGHEGLCGDPLFIDTEDEDFPVYTADHGDGSWSARLIAFSFRHFGQILHRLHELSRDRSNPVQLEQHPLADGERISFMEFIRRESPDVDFAFWESLFELR